MNNLKSVLPEANVIDGININKEEILDKISKSVQDNKITILNLPAKKSANDIGVKLWDQVILTKKWQALAKKAKIPYETEWFVVSCINKDIDGKTISYNLTGSMSGCFSNVDFNEGDVIERVIGNMMLF